VQDAVNEGLYYKTQCVDDAINGQMKPNHKCYDV